MGTFNSLFCRRLGTLVSPVNNCTEAGRAYSIMIKIRQIWPNEAVFLLVFWTAISTC